MTALSIILLHYTEKLHLDVNVLSRSLVYTTKAYSIYYILFFVILNALPFYIFNI